MAENGYWRRWIYGGVNDMARYSAYFKKIVMFSAPLVACVLVVGCSSMDPQTQPYTWRPLHIYEANIAAQVERKSDLVSGRKLGPSDGHEAAEAVQRWRDGKVKKLPNTDVAQVQSGSNSENSEGSGN